MPSLVRQLVTAVSTYGSLIALVYAVKPPSAGFSAFEKGLLAAATLVLVADVVLSTFEYSRRGERRYRRGPKQSIKIRDFMCDWISNEGRVVVFTRDLTWVKEADRDLLTLLESKARSADLTIVLPHHTPLTQHLEAVGAEVVTYPRLGHTIQSRFTVVGLGRGGARVAIGHNHGGDHVIRLAGPDDPAFYLAADLVEIMKRM